jgi:hypothetical protein
MTTGKTPRFIRVRVTEHGALELSGLEIELSDYGLCKNYESVDSLPKWIQDKLRKLQVLNVPPPGVTVEDVGERMSVNTFWVYV